jgi:hypothetical protein
MSRERIVKLTDFERDVTISLLNTALAGWEGDQARQNAAQRTIDKLMAVDAAEAEPEKGR